MADEYYYLQRKDWRAIGYNFEVLSRYGNTSRAYCLTDFQVAWLLSNTDYMAWSTRWSNCPCTEQDLIDMKAELDYRLMSCIDIQPYMLAALYKQLEQSQLNELQALWDADPTPGAVNPSTPDDFYSGDDSQERLDALCTACKIYVYSYAQNWVVLAQTALGIVAVVSLFSAITLVGGVIATTIFAGVALVTALALDAMQSKTALDNVACCMYAALNGQAITQANFIDCLDGCDFEVGSNESIVRDLIASDLDQFSNWLTFINQLGNSFDLAEIGVIDCPCADAWEYTFDFVSGSYDFVAYDPAGNGINYGTYVASSGWDVQSKQWSSSPNQYRRAVGIKRSWDTPTTITEVSATYNYTKGTFSGVVTALALGMYLDNAVQANVSELSSVITSGPAKVKTITNEVIANNIRFYFATSATTNGTYSGAGLIKSITVKGIGYNPFI